MKNLLVLVFAMGIVTYLPRMLPVVLLNNLKLPPFLRAFFQFVPYAAIGALIFPGIMTSTGSTASAAAGGVIALGLAFFRLNIMIVVLGGIAGAYIFG